MYCTSPKSPSPPAKARRMIVAMLTKKEMTAAPFRPMPGSIYVVMKSALTGITTKYIKSPIPTAPAIEAAMIGRLLF